MGFNSAFKGLIKNQTIDKSPKKIISVHLKLLIEHGPRSKHTCFGL